MWTSSSIISNESVLNRISQDLINNTKPLYEPNVTQSSDIVLFQQAAMGAT